MTRFLIDTHILIFYFTEQSRLTKIQLDFLNDKGNEIFVSSISYFKMATLVRLKKIELGMTISEFYFMQQNHGFKNLDYSIEEIEMLSKIIPLKDHRDPVDLLLICQSLNQNIKIITNDKFILQYF